MLQNTHILQVSPFFIEVAYMSFFHHLTVVQLFCHLKKGLTPDFCMLCNAILNKLFFF